MFGVPLATISHGGGFRELTLLTLQDSSATWVPVAVDLEAAAIHHHRHGLPGHQIIRMGNTDGLWALWLELVHAARHYEAEGVGLVGHPTADEITPFPRSWFIRQMLSRRHPPGKVVNRITDIRQLQSVN